MRIIGVDLLTRSGLAGSPSGALRGFPSCVEMESNLELVEQLYCCSDPVAYPYSRMDVYEQFSRSACSN
jgi:hypothetical protein